MRRLILAVALAVSLLTVSAGTAAASAPRLPVVYGALGWNQDLTRPSFLGALYSRVPPKAIDANVVLETLRWSAWGQRSAHGTGRVSWAQPGPGGNGISRQAPVTVTLSAVATHGGRRYFSRLAFSFTWRGHTVSTPGPRGSRTRAATQPGAGLPPAPPSHYTALLQPRCTRGGMKMSQLFKWCSARIVMVTAFGTVTGICG